MASYVLIFIYLGAFMNQSGMGKFFIDMPMALAGRTVGGPAKVAVIALRHIRFHLGQQHREHRLDGHLHHPAHEKGGLQAPRGRPRWKTAPPWGGQLLPPVMGSGAFVMAEITGVPYVRIMAIAAVPALLYLLSICAIVHFEAKRQGHSGNHRG